MNQTTSKFYWCGNPDSKWKYRVLNNYEHVCRYVMNLPEDRICGLMEDPNFDIGAASMTLREGYTWNGSDVVVDMESDMLASAVHDLHCQMMERGFFQPTLYNWRMAAAEYRNNCIIGGMPKWRAWSRYMGILIGGGNGYKWRGVLKRGR